jgi:hypothetical protein
VNWLIFTAGVFGVVAAFGWGLAAYLHAKLRSERESLTFLRRELDQLRGAVNARKGAGRG